MKKILLIAAAIFLASTTPAIAEDWLEFRSNYYIDIESLAAKGDNSYSIDIRETPTNRIIRRQLAFICSSSLPVVVEMYRLELNTQGQVLSKRLCENNILDCVLNNLSRNDRALQQEICSE